MIQKKAKAWRRYKVQASLQGLNVITDLNTTTRLQMTFSAAWSPQIPTVPVTMLLQWGQKLKVLTTKKQWWAKLRNLRHRFKSPRGLYSEVLILGSSYAFWIWRSSFSEELIYGGVYFRNFTVLFLEEDSRTFYRVTAWTGATRRFSANQKYEFKTNQSEFVSYFGSTTVMVKSREWILYKMFRAWTALAMIGPKMTRSPLPLSRDCLLISQKSLHYNNYFSSGLSYLFTPTCRLSWWNTYIQSEKTTTTINQYVRIMHWEKYSKYANW